AVSALALQVRVISERSVRRTLRQPAAIIPASVFPIMLLFVSSGGLHAAENLPGFPDVSYFDFALSVTFMQGAIFATGGAGTDLATDIDTGFLNRLALTPMSGAALVLGVFQATCYLAAGFLGGATIASGIGGVVVLYLLVILMAIGFGALGVAAALRTGNGEAVQGLFPVLFVLLFLSTINLPLDLIPITWFRWAATVNPITYLVDAVRSLIITGWDWPTLAAGFAVALGISILGILLSAVALRGRLQRT
ncbi:MAG: ABC transporter permease, partial [Gaiellales bacterium]